MALLPHGGPSLHLPRTTFARTQAAQCLLLSSRLGHTSIPMLSEAHPCPSSPMPPGGTFSHSSPYLLAVKPSPGCQRWPVSASLSLYVLKLRGGFPGLSSETPSGKEVLWPVALAQAQARGFFDAGGRGWAGKELGRPRLQ